MANKNFRVAVILPGRSCEGKQTIFYFWPNMQYNSVREFKRYNYKEQTKKCKTVLCLIKDYWLTEAKFHRNRTIFINSFS